MLVKESGPADGEPENDSRPLHGRGNDVRAVTLLRSALLEGVVAPSERVREGVCRRGIIASMDADIWGRATARGGPIARRKMAVGNRRKQTECILWQLSVRSRNNLSSLKYWSAEDLHIASAE
jgi:hypothetical protein